MRITIQKPTDQPSGENRLLDQIKINLLDSDLVDFKIIVAFAKLGPLLRLKRHIINWRVRGKTIGAMIGVDEKGTSLQALEFALEHFNKTYIAHIEHGAFNPTFHPKIYLFKGSSKAIAYIGSNNLTLGGTEINSESNVKFELSFPEDQETYTEIESCWNSTEQITKELNAYLLKQLVESGMVVDEKRMRDIRLASRSVLPRTTIKRSEMSLPTIKIMPPSPLPKFTIKKTKLETTLRSKQVILEEKFIAQAFVIQIVPHHNGEIFLSKIAINQNPGFFGFPFIGKTKPKKSSNPSYPQREPDPIVNITVYDKKGSPIVQHEKFNLNTVYYDTKSEIRITVPQDIVKNTPPYSILLMSLAPEEEAYDYDIGIFVPGSQKYNENLAVCNRAMPSGGKESPRRFGWL